MAAPVTASPIFTRAQEVLASAVIGVLIEGPVTLHNVRGEYVVVTETVVNIRAVVHELHHVAGHFRSVVDPHPVRSSVLLVK